MCVLWILKMWYVTNKWVPCGVLQPPYGIAGPRNHHVRFIINISSN